MIRALLLLLAQQPVESPVAPAEARTLMQVAPGLRVELVAAEPRVQSPVAMAFGADGRLWVVEMLDYPTPDPARPPNGRVKWLEDRDGDGVYERATVFADRLLLANGVHPWKDGVIVTAAPRILHLRDTDGDGKADKREVLFEGFALGNPQLRASHPVFAMDNWIYVANGQRGGKIRPGTGTGKGGPVDIGGLDFRFDPVRGRFEPVAGMGQFGLTFDDWGRRFVCTNRNHLIPIPMENRYFARNPLLARPARAGDNQGIGGAARVYPVGRQKVLADHHAGYFTASCGITVYRGAALPEEFRGDVFTCEPTGNLVHREALAPNGATFAGRRVREGVEFLASPDPWFRPVMLTHGPDGAFYVVDMYREEVEHPQWVPEQYLARYNFEGRKDLGRIWKIVPEGKTGAAPKTDLSAAPVERLVALLEHPDAWWRMTAQRLLVERQDASAVEGLRTLASRSKSPLGRTHAAWTLEGLGSLTPELVGALLRDSHPRVRENALELSERFIADHAGVQEAVIRLAGDADARIRFRVALALGEWDDDAKLAPLGRIAARGGDVHTRLAVQSAVPKRAGALVGHVEDPDLRRELATLVGSRGDRTEVAGLLGALRGQKDAMSLLGGLVEGMGRRGGRLADHLRADGTRNAVEALMTAAAEDARRGGESAIALLAHVPWDRAGGVLAGLLEHDAPSVRLAAIRALSRHRHETVAPSLMASWRRYLPPERREVLEAMVRRTDRVAVLFDRIEGGDVAPGELGSALIKRLRDHKDPALRARARKLLRVESSEARKAVIARYAEALALEGDAGRGAAVFTKNCASCHRLGDIGTHVGPDIADTFRRTSEALMVDILDPSRAIDNNYVNYLVRTKSGTVLSGFVAEQTAASITLRRGADQQDVVLRADIEQMKSSGTSLMPEGLETNITPAQMADLLAFLKGGWRKAAGR